MPPWENLSNCKLTSHLSTDIPPLKNKTRLFKVTQNCLSGKQSITQQYICLFYDYARPVILFQAIAEHAYFAGSRKKKLYSLYQTVCNKIGTEVLVIVHSSLAFCRFLNLSITPAWLMLMSLLSPGLDSILHNVLESK